MVDPKQTIDDCGCLLDEYELPGQYVGWVRTLCEGCQLDRLYPQSWRPDASNS